MPLTSEQELLELYKTGDLLEKSLMVWGDCGPFYNNYFESEAHVGIRATRTPEGVLSACPGVSP